jgi:hypothetical protein
MFRMFSNLLRQTLSLLLVVCVTIPFVPPTKVAASLVDCVVGGAIQNGYEVAPSHGKAFYIDTGTNPRLDASYIAYRVTNKTGLSKNNIWVEVRDFNGGVISLVNQDDALAQLPATANNSTSTAFFFMKASGATNVPQSHTVHIYENHPLTLGNSPLYSCTYTFSTVRETISAASNKVTNITSSTNSPGLGETFTVTINGETGVVGNGAAPDGKILMLSPAAVSSWPTRALRLESTSVSFSRPGNANYATFTNQLLIPGASINNNSTYVATYTYRVVGRPTNTVQLVPVAQIASGAQIKHSDTSAAGAAISLSFPTFTVQASVEKRVTATEDLATTTIDGVDYVGVPFQIEITSSTSTTLSLDEIIDIPSSGTIFKEGSGVVTDVDRTNQPITPILYDDEVDMNPQPYHFVGPFRFNSGRSAVVDYVMWIPEGTVENVAYARSGDLVIGQSPSSIPRIIITSDGSASIEAEELPLQAEPQVLTAPATSIATSSAVLNGVIDPKGIDPFVVAFDISTSPTLLDETSLQATSPTNGDVGGELVPTNASVSITGLSSGTTYYYRARAEDYLGDIVSFTTLAVLAPPTVSVLPPTDITLTQGTMNGTINPNLTTVTAIQFIYSTSSTFASGNTTLTLPDEGAALQIGGSSLQAFSTTTLTLLPGQTYYYKIRACTTSSGTFPSITCSVFVDSSVTSFVTGLAPLATTTSATSVNATRATLNADVNPNYVPTEISFDISTTSDLSVGISTFVIDSTLSGTATSVSKVVSGLQKNTTYYFRVYANNDYGGATGTILSFTTENTNRSLVIEDSSYEASYSFVDEPPTITATPSDGGGNTSYESLTPDVCVIDSVTGVVVFVGTGTCELIALIEEDGEWTEVDSDIISFEVSPSPRTLLINQNEFNMSYEIDDDLPLLLGLISPEQGSISYTSLTPLICTINQLTGEITVHSIGTCTLQVDVTDESGYENVVSQSLTFNVTRKSRSLQFDNQSFSTTYQANNTPPTVVANPSKGPNNVEYASLTADVCEVDPSTGQVTFVGVGNCVLFAVANEDGDYNEAVANVISFTILETSSPRPTNNQPPRKSGGSTLQTRINNLAAMGNQSAIDALRQQWPGVATGVGPTQNSQESSSQSSKEFAADSCEKLLTQSIQLGANNDPEEVKKLQTFLNDFENESLVVDGLYKTEDFEAVKRFQTTHSSILSFWNLSTPTGLVYISTRNKINSIYCEQAKGIDCPYFTEAANIGTTHNEVPRIKDFLNRVVGTSLDIQSNLYDIATSDAVRLYQQRNISRILAPWGLTTPTGFWYQSTMKVANDDVGCFSSVRLDNGVVIE